jgi:hypothetical protein
VAFNKQCCLNRNDSGDIDGNRFIGNVLIRVFPFPIFNQPPWDFQHRSSFRLHDHIRKVCALVEATLILPALAYAAHDNGKGNDGENNCNGNDRGDKHIPVVPEANAGWVLVPFFVATVFPCDGGPK